MKKIVILGGGTAGWLTALLVQRYYPKYHITLVESEEIIINLNHLDLKLKNPL